MLPRSIPIAIAVISHACDAHIFDSARNDQWKELRPATMAAIPNEYGSYVVDRLKRRSAIVHTITKTGTKGEIDADGSL
ncbi:hypothetical protein CHELA20_51623 [Hyphomicrobiales bacterium]|nr:hypothetical protein CHELA41_23389 [Hyphomicrobiales bacterium]CAH1677349.1 hypothetical protein CHELA20_51623 [Hyphomicrobiales bacterium]